MSYEVEAIAPDFASPTQTSVWRPERTVDHSEFSPRRNVPAVENKVTPVEGEQKPVETQTPPPEEKPSVTLSPAAAALARKEQRVRQQQLDLQKQQEALEAERKEIAELRELKRKLDAKDFSGIENQVPYDAYTNYLIEKNTPVSPEQEELKTLREDVKSIKDAYQSETEKRFEAAVQQRREAVKTLIESNPEYSSIKEMDAAEHVVRHIIDTFEEEGVELTPEQAAKDVEDVILERAKRWGNISKLRPQEPPKQEEPKKVLPALKPVVNTLTNVMSATGDVKQALKRNYANMRSDAERWAAARSAVAASGESLKG